MQKIKLASPLYIVREQCEKDLFSVLEKLKEIGFDGIEFLGFFGKTPEDIRKKLEELKLEALGNHVDYQVFKSNTKETIKAHKTIGCKYITLSGLPKEKLSDETEMKEYLNTAGEIGRQCREEGITLLYHNHDREFQVKKDGKFIMEHILEEAPELSAEPDLGWMLIGGGNPGDFLEKYQNRCPVIHLKDFYAEDIKGIGNVSELGADKGDKLHSYFEFRPVGYGIAQTPALSKKILKCNPEWLVADHDLSYERDSYFDLEISLEFIKNLILMQ